MSTPELHRPLPLDRIGPTGLEQEIIATAAECAALAERLGVPAVASLTCRFRLSRGLNGLIFAQGHLRARLTRICVISLEEFEAGLTEDFRLRFVPEGEENDQENEELDPDFDDEIPYSGTIIDLGEAAAEQLALSLDPYPRKPGAELPDDAVSAPESAFAALSRRRPRN